MTSETAEQPVARKQATVSLSEVQNNIFSEGQKVPKETMKEEEAKIFRTMMQIKNVDLETKLQLTRESNGLHSALRLTLFSGRLMGLLPLEGLMNPRSHELRFALRTPYGLVYFISLLGQLLLFIMSLYWLTYNKASMTNMTNFIFYCSSIVSSAILAKIGRQWPRLVMKVEAIESRLPPLTTNIPMYCNIIMVFILLAALGSLLDIYLCRFVILALKSCQVRIRLPTQVCIEHLSSVFYGVTVAKVCDPNNIVETFFLYDKPWIFTYTSYSLWKGILIEVFNIQSTFIWTYNDLLIMVISIYITEHFKVLNRLFIVALRQEHYSCDEFRTQHLKIIRLVKLINEQIGIYILICFGSNLYWICTQLFYSLNKSQTGHFASCSFKGRDNHNSGMVDAHGIEHTVYFTYSFSFLVTRTFLVLLLAARVNSASTTPLVLLYEIPSYRFNVEVERFIAQINNIKVALSGLDFFYVTKTMILTLMGTMVTYELVLLQFNK